MNKQNNFTKKDFNNINDDWKQFEPIRDGNGDFIGVEEDCWFTHFEFCLKDGRHFRFDMNNDLHYTLRSDKYGEFEVNPTEKVIADIMRDNDRFYVIKQEMDFIKDLDYYHTASLVATRYQDFFTSNFNKVVDVAKIFISKALDDNNFATITEIVK